MSVYGRQKKGSIRGLENMKTEKVRMGLIILSFSAVFSFNIFYFSTIQPAKLSKNVDQGTLYYFVDEKNYWSEITDFCCLDGFLYVLYQRYAILQIYDPSGNYYSSYAFYDTNGRGSLGIDGEHAYLEDRNNNWYLFKDGTLIKTLPYTDYHSYLEIEKKLYDDSIDARSSDDGYYYMRGASIYFHDNEAGTNRCIVKRPLFLIIYQGVWLTLVAASCILGAAGCIIVMQVTERNDRSTKRAEKWKIRTVIPEHTTPEGQKSSGREPVSEDAQIILTPGSRAIERLIVPLIVLLIGAVVFTIASSDIIPIFIFFLVLFSALALRMIMVYYRTIVFSKDGITIRFLFLKKTYPWERIRTKQYVDYSCIEGVPGFEEKNGCRLESQDYVTGAFFLPKKMRKGIDQYPELFCEIHHPWTCVFVSFSNPDDSTDNAKEIRLEGYVVNENDFISQLAVWGINLDAPS